MDQLEKIVVQNLEELGIFDEKQLRNMEVSNFNEFAIRSALEIAVMGILVIGYALLLFTKEFHYFHKMMERKRFNG